MSRTTTEFIHYDYQNVHDTDIDMKDVDGSVTFT